MRDIKQIASEINEKYPEISDQINELIKLYEDHIAFTEELRNALAESSAGHRNAMAIANDLQESVKRYERIIDKLLE